MKRLVVMTVGKTHSGKSTFAKRLEGKLAHSFVMDQDIQAQFLNASYAKLIPKKGPNILKHKVTEAIVQYAVKATNLNVIVCNANLSKADREYLMNSFYPSDQFISIIVYVNLPDERIVQRILTSNRSSNIMRGQGMTFEKIYRRQQQFLMKEGQTPSKEEVDYFFEIKEEEDQDLIIDQIVTLSKE